MNILLITTFFPPDTAIAAVRPYMFAKYLTRLGHTVTVLRSGEINRSADSYFEEIPGLRVISFLGENSPAEAFERGQWTQPQKSEKSRISFLPAKLRLPLAKAYHSAMRPVAFRNRMKRTDARFQLQKAALNRMAGERFDVVFSTFSELENVYAGAYAAELFGCKWVLDFRDLIAYRSLLPAWEYRKMREIQSQAVNSADLCTAVSQGLADILAAQSVHVPVKLLRNGYEENDAPPRSTGKKQGVLSFCYTGQLYGDRTLAPLFQSIRQLHLPLEQIELHYAGPSSDVMFQQAGAYHMEQMIVDHGYVSRQECEALQASTDIFLVTSWNRRNEGGVMTGKFYEGIRSRTPILSLISGDLPNSELYQLNEQYHYGFCYESCRGQAHFQEFCGYLKQAFSQKMENGQVPYQPAPELFTDFRYDSLARQLESIFQELTEG